MMTDKFNLNWQSFSDHLQLMFKYLYEEERHSDVTLVCDDQTQFKAHKIVLSACSQVFKNIIENNPSQHPLIYLRGIQSFEMESILQFMYLGEGRFDYERLGEFMKVAKDLEVKEICKGDVTEETTIFSVVADRMATQSATFDNEEMKTEEDEENQISSVVKSESPECGKVFTTEGILLTNIESKHKGIKYPCNQCNYQATQKSTLKRHIASEHEGVKYPCNQCDYQAKRQHHLQRHIESLHEGVKHPCNQCHHEASSKEGLRRHIQSKHEEIKYDGIKYPCNECDYQAKRKDLLQRHVESIHEGVKYPCNQCNYQASCQSDLQKHTRSIHEGIKYPCNQCNHQASSRVLK